MVNHLRFWALGLRFKSGQGYFFCFWFWICSLNRIWTSSEILCWEFLRVTFTSLCFVRNNPDRATFFCFWFWICSLNRIWTSSEILCWEFLRVTFTSLCFVRNNPDRATFFCFWFWTLSSHRLCPKWCFFVYCLEIFLRNVNYENQRFFVMILHFDNY